MTFQIYPFGIKDMTPPEIPMEGPQHLLGGKGAGLHWMASVGVQVPPGFVIPTTAWAEYKKKPATMLKLIKKEVQPYVDGLKNQFGYMPLLSVRSGARVSCPGMMDTILNVGIDTKTLQFWSKRLGEKCFENSLHRLIIMYGSVVKGIDRKSLEDGDTDSAIAVYNREAGEDFPDFEGQLIGAIEAVFKSWDNERAKVYRKMNGIPDEWGTAVTVQSMVFGNLNDKSGTGVLFTRNPDTGENKVTGEFMVNAQGEDVVAGIRTPMPLSKMVEWNSQVAINLNETVVKLEKLKKDVQDVEFTVQDGQLYLLQTRNAKRTPQASLKIALDMFEEGMLTAGDAASRIDAKTLDLAQVPKIASSFKKAPNYKGLSACSGVVTGKPVFTSKAAVASKEPCILITDETTPDDIAGMKAAVGVITMTGGSTSHAAVVARGMNKPCITGVGAKTADFHVEQVGMDGSTGNIWLCKVPVMDGASQDVVDFKQLVRKLHGVVPIIFDVPTENLEEALLYLGGSVIDVDDAVAKVEYTSKKVKKLYLDVTEGETEEEKTYFSMIGGCLTPNLLIARLEQKTFQNEIVIVGGVSKKFKSIDTSDSLEAAIMSSGAITITGNISPAMKRVLNWRKQEGIDVVSIGHKVQGAKSMVSMETLLAK